MPHPAEITMTSATARPRSLDELALLGTGRYARDIRPTLRPEDDGKFVALDVDTGDYEIDEDDYAALMRLRARRPTGDLWLERVGEPAADRFGGRGL